MHTRIRTYLSCHHVLSLLWPPRKRISLLRRRGPHNAGVRAARKPPPQNQKENVAFPKGQETSSYSPHLSSFVMLIIHYTHNSHNVTVLSCYSIGREPGLLACSLPIKIVLPTFLFNLTHYPYVIFRKVYQWLLFLKLLNSLISTNAQLSHMLTFRPYLIPHQKIPNWKIKDPKPVAKVGWNTLPITHISGTFIISENLS